MIFYLTLTTAKFDGPRIFVSEGRETVENTGFAGQIAFSWSIVGAVGGIRTLGRLMTATRFPVVLVMTSSIPLHKVWEINDLYYSQLLLRCQDKL